VPIDFIARNISTNPRPIRLSPLVPQPSQAQGSPK
jgi:hypothetical protein